MSIRKFLFHIVPEYTTLFHAEIKSICSLLNYESVVIHPPEIENSPVVIVELDKRCNIEYIAKRSLTTKSILSLISQQPSYEKLLKLPAIQPADIEPNQSFCVRMHSFQEFVPHAEQVRRIHEIVPAVLKIADENPIKLKNPDVLFEYFEIYQRRDRVEDDECRLKVVYVGQHLYDGQRGAERKYSLEERCFIANTSMCPLLSLVMSNMACVTEGSLVFDPFCGSGSCLVAAALHGGYCFGTDIAYLLLHGNSKPTRAKQEKRKPNESVRGNFIQYGVEDRYIDVCVGDISSLDKLWSDDLYEAFDAIVTDPPYGIREAGQQIIQLETEVIVKKACFMGEAVTGVHDPGWLPHFPQKETYNQLKLYCDLVDMAMRLLRPPSSNDAKDGGRLVYWMPSVSSTFNPRYDLPHHPHMEIISVCEQVLSPEYSRQLVTMRKVAKLADIVPQGADHRIYDAAHFERNPFLDMGSFHDHYHHISTKTSNHSKKKSKQKSSLTD